MRDLIPRRLAGLLASALLLSLVAESACAGKLSVNERRFRLAWASLTFGQVDVRVRCAVTLEGSFHSATFTKARGALMGQITRGALARPCVGGDATLLAETLPWHLRYRGFSGTLPAITSIDWDAIGVSFKVRPEPSIECLMRSTVTKPVHLLTILRSGTVTEAPLDRFERIPLEGLFCAFAGEGEVEGSASVTRLAATGSVVISLIA